MLKIEQIQGSCQYCKNRYVGCHGKCEEYQKFREKLDHINELKYKEKTTLNALWEYCK